MGKLVRNRSTKELSEWWDKVLQTAKTAPKLNSKENEATRETAYEQLERNRERRLRD